MLWLCASQNTFRRATASRTLQLFVGSSAVSVVCRPPHTKDLVTHPPESTHGLLLEQKGQLEGLKAKVEGGIAVAAGLFVISALDTSELQSLMVNYLSGQWYRSSALKAGHPWGKFF